MERGRKAGGHGGREVQGSGLTIQGPQLRVEQGRRERGTWVEPMGIFLASISASSRHLIADTCIPVAPCSAITPHPLHPSPHHQHHQTAQTHTTMPATVCANTPRRDSWFALPTTCDTCRQLVILKWCVGCGEDTLQVGCCQTLWQPWCDGVMHTRWRGHRGQVK